MDNQRELTKVTIMLFESCTQEESEEIKKVVKEQFLSFKIFPNDEFEVLIEICADEPRTKYSENLLLEELDRLSGELYEVQNVIDEFVNEEHLTRPSKYDTLDEYLGHVFNQVEKGY